MRISDWSSDVCSSDLTASRRASVLSIGQESGHIQAMIARYRDNSNRDAATVRNGERDLEQVRSRLATLEGLDDARRSEERRVGKECGIKFRSRWSARH